MRKIFTSLCALLMAGTMSMTAQSYELQVSHVLCASGGPLGKYIPFSTETPGSTLTAD